MNPAQFRLLLAGPKVSRLLPFFTSRGYVADAAINGEEALEQMRMAPRHVLLVELELEDMLLADLLDEVRKENLAGAIILMDDPAKSGLIVATLLRGVDGYVATPPDENYMFRLIERQLLAQWAMAQSGQTASDNADKSRLEKAVQMERAKVTELVKEIASLREELHRSKARAAPPLVPSRREEIQSVLDDASESFEGVGDDFSEALTQHRSNIPGFHDDDMDPALKTTPTRKPAVSDERTSPAGWDPPKLKPTLNDVDDDEGAFDDVPHTRPANTAPKPAPKAPPKPAPKVDDASESDLFLDLEEEQTSEVDVRAHRKQPKTP